VTALLAGILREVLDRMIDHVLPPWLFGTNARQDLTLILAALSVLLAVLVPALVWLVRRWTTRLTVRFTEPILPRWEPRGGLRCGGRSLTVAGIGNHPLRLVVNARKTDLLYKLNVACLDRRRFSSPRSLRIKRAPRDVVRLRDIRDERGDPLDSVTDPYDGSVTADYVKGVAKGARPFGLALVLVASKPWSGWVSVRDEATNRTGRVRLRIVPGDPPPPF